MSVGTYISGVGHSALVVWLLAGWGLDSEPLEFDVTEVSVISGDAFEVMMRAGQPDAPVEEIAAPVVPQIEEPPLPEPAEPEAPPVVAEPPEPVVQPVEETPPEPPAPVAPPAPPVDVLPELPEIPVEPAPAPATELSNAPRPQPRPAPRIAPEPVAPPEPDAVIDDQVAEATSDAPADTPVEEPVEETTSPEEAAPEIVTEAETPSGAPEISLRPQSRPNRPAPQTASEEPTEEVDPVAAALAEAVASETASEPTAGVSGGDLSDAAKTSFLRQIGNCWNVGSASTGALQTRVTVGFSMTPDGLLDANSIRLLGFTGGSQADADVAYRIARSALVRCQTDAGRAGYDLPQDQYDLWRNVELTFNPERMRTR